VADMALLTTSHRPSSVMMGCPSRPGSRFDRSPSGRCGAGATNIRASSIVQAGFLGRRCSIALPEFLRKGLQQGQSRRSSSAIATAVTFGAEDHLILTGDIGGTNSRLQFWSMKAGDELEDDPDNKGASIIPGVLLHEDKFPNEGFESFDAVLKQFMADTVKKCNMDELRSVSVAVLAVAGPVEDDTVSFTNRSHWEISARELEENCGIGKAKLLNDFVSNGYGLLTLGKNDLHCLQDVPQVKGAPIALLGAGTGLGECFLTCSNGVYSCWASEGGHVEFSPRSATELQLLSSLFNKFYDNHRVSVERIVSGLGISNVYDFFRQRYPGAVNKIVDDEIMAMGDQRAGLIAHNYANDMLCQWTMQLVWATYGSEAGAIALKVCFTFPRTQLSRIYCDAAMQCTCRFSLAPSRQ